MRKLIKHFIPFIFAVFLSLPAQAVTMNGCDTTAMQGCSASFSPLFFGDDLPIWVDNSSNSNFTINGGGLTGAVSSWHDLSGNSNDIDQSVAADQPNWDGTKVTFDGVSEFLASNSFTGGTLSQPTTIFIVVQQSSNSTAGRHFYDGIETTNRQTFRDTGSGIGFYRDFAGVDLNTSLAPDLVKRIISVNYNGASSVSRSNGVSIHAANIGTNSLAGVTLGGRFDGTSLMDGFIYEFIIINRTLTTTEHNQLGNYLATKHGLTWTDIP